ncbi:MAG: RNA-binding protein [Anaerolineae bacterium]|nr:RNA-binding protein [Anaerolineae bacterium]
MEIFVCNLSSEVTEEDLRRAFEAFGKVSSARIKRMGDEGFGFVNMRARLEAQAAIAGLNGQELKGQTLTVHMAPPRPD